MQRAPAFTCTSLQDMRGWPSQRGALAGFLLFRFHAAFAGLPRQGRILRGLKNGSVGEQASGRTDDADAQDSVAAQRALHLHPRFGWRAWFCESGASKIGRFDTGDFTFREFDIPVPDAMPIGITAGADGNMWFCAKKANAIGRVTTAGEIVLFPVPTPNRR